MYIHVKLLNGFKESLTYRVPATWDPAALLGTLVEVPLQKRTEKALVVDVLESVPPVAYTIKEAIAQEQIPLDASYAPWIQMLCSYYASTPQVLYKRLRTFLDAKKIETDDDHAPTQHTVVQLTDAQQSIVDAIVQDIDTDTYAPHLIHGVTGSGKTEVYKQCIEAAFALKKTVLFLVPEVSLAVQFTHIFKNHFGEHAPIYGFHSAIPPKQKKELWNILLAQQPAIIIGVHLPLLLPLPNLGLIIIDEEHDPGFQEKRHPRINTKEAALMRARSARIPIVLGSATPAISTLALAQEHQWPIHTLYTRFKGAFPRITLVRLTKDPRRSFWITRELEAALNEALAQGEQAIIFLNRRGYSFFVQCGDCSFVFSCTRCSVSLTLHNTHTIVCHYCGYFQPVPPACPSCKASEKSFIRKGIGTQQVVSILEKLFPHARVGRADLDTTQTKKKWETLEKFARHELDILVGTQTITKGYHFPKVTCVGILWADINLHFPFYTAAETTLQQLVQVAGRAGRQSEKSTVIIQTMLDHPLYSFITEEKYRDFYAYESAHRKVTQYPPHIRFAEIELRHTEERQVEKDAYACADFLMAVIEKNNLPIQVLGPAQPPVHTIKNVSTYKLYLKGRQYAQFARLYTLATQNGYKSTLLYTPNPLS